MKQIIKQILLKGSLWLLVICGVAALILSRRPLEPDQAPPPVVTVTKPVKKDVTQYYEFTGTTESVAFVEIRARVEGFLESIHYKDSDLVRRGDLLFVIDPDEYEARRDEAAAELRAAEADLEGTQVDLERILEAAKTNAVSQREVSTRKAQRDGAVAKVKGAEALLQEAELKLSYTRVYSPVTGRTSRRLVDIGNLVGAEEKTVLTTVVKMQPMYVYFDVSELIVLDALEGRSKKERRDPQKEFYIGLANEEGYSIKGMIDYIDNRVDPDTGTIKVRGVFSNEQEKLLPGMFVRVKVPGKVQQEAMLVQEEALGTDIAGKYLLVVDEDNIVEQRQVTIGVQDDQMRVIEEGILEDETYIVNGLLRARPGMPVAPESASGIRRPETGEKKPVENSDKKKTKLEDED